MNLFLIVCSISIIFTSDIKDNFFLNSQSRLNSFVIYENFFNKNYNFSKLNPNVEKFELYRSLFYFNNCWHKLNDLDTYFKIQSNLGLQNNKFRSIFNISLFMEILPNLFLQNDFEFDSDGYFDKNYKGNLTQSAGKWTGYSQHSSITYFDNWGHLLIGKINLSFSNENESVLINGIHPPSETIWWRVNKKNLKFDRAIVSLDSINSKQRLLILSRYSYNRNNKLKFGFTEMCLMSYTNLGQGEFKYLLPSSVLFENEVNSNYNTNLFWLFDWEYKFDDNILFGEFLIDDYALDGLSPHKLALNVNYLFKITDLINLKSFARLQYTRINRWVGNYYDKELRMISNNIMIGHQLGPDAHKIDIYMYFDLDEIFFSKVNFFIVERGSGNINEWPEGIGSSANFGWSEEQFPSTPSKIDSGINFNLDYLISNSYLLSLFFKLSENGNELKIEMIYNI